MHFSPHRLLPRCCPVRHEFFASDNISRNRCRGRITALALFAPNYCEDKALICDDEITRRGSPSRKRSRKRLREIKTDPLPDSIVSSPSCKRLSF